MTQQAETRFVVGDPFRLGDWMIDPRLNRLTRNDESIQIELKMMDVLVCLAEHAGELVERQQLIDTVWATEFISENILTRAVAELRRILGDDAKHPTYIETIHRRGYRLIAAIEPVEATVHPLPTPTVSSREERSPYPGLSAFTEDDAEFFFGRETEVAKLWRKLTSRRLLAVIGPSGVGKSSLLRAGLIPSAPEGWGTLICQPGEAPSAALARSLAPEFEGDPEAISMLVDISNVNAALVLLSRWRQLSGRALLIIDQFEELFTLNAADVQTRFAILLGRLARKADVHVLLSMRDDFLFRCHEQPSLSPIFDGITPISTPPRSDLRRALTEPAARFGFVFEGETIVEEMLDAVEGERGGLPLLAFAVARLWAARDRDRRLLTRESYNAIGGVSGALAQHAESALSTIGTPKLPIVREIFRNLVTAEGTRAVREWDELLSVFSDAGSESPAEVLRALIDARLLTSYEVREEDNAPTRQVEIVHESLLANWPRLVRWRTQDADAAQLRDQLRQAARTWDEHGRTDDYLWSGRAYREYSVWRESYPGGLSELEEAFAASMTSHATRRRRRRRIVAAAALAFALVVAGVFATLWRRSVLETRRAEAAKLLALAQVQLETDPSEALAFTTASLELADTREARVFSIRALVTGTPVFALDLEEWSDGGSFMLPAFSPDGRWLAAGGLVNGKVIVWNEHGGAPIVLEGHAISASGPVQCAWTRDGLLVTGHWTEGRVRVWSVPDCSLYRTIEFGGPTWWMVGEKHLLAELRPPIFFGVQTPFELGRWELPNGELESLGTIDWTALGASQSRFDPSGERWLYSKDNRVYSRVVPVTSDAPDQVVGRHTHSGIEFGYFMRADPVYSVDGANDIIVWNADDGMPAVGRHLRRPDAATARLRPDSSGHWVVEDTLRDAGQVALWNLTNLRSADPWKLRRSGAWFLSQTAIDPQERWIVATTKRQREISFWPLPTRLPIVVEGWTSYGFSPDGRFIVASDFELTNLRASRVRLWPMPGSGTTDFAEVKLPDGSHSGNFVAVDPTNRFVLSTWYGDSIFVLPIDGGPPRKLEGFPDKDQVVGAFSPSGNLVAVASSMSDVEPTLQIWDLQTGEERVFVQPRDPEALQGGFANVVEFIDDTTLLSSGTNGLVRWNVETGAHEILLKAPPGGDLEMQTTVEAGKVLVSEMDSWVRRSGVALYDLVMGAVKQVDIPGDDRVILSPDGSTWATANQDGSVLVGRTEGGEPHLLIGPPGASYYGAISHDQKWIALNPSKSTVLWPMPDLDKPPLHTLPHDELIAKLHSLTNLRAVRDDASPTGWKIEVGPFPGWAEVPNW